MKRDSNQPHHEAEFIPVKCIDPVRPSLGRLRVDRPQPSEAELYELALLRLQDDGCPLA